MFKTNTHQPVSLNFHFYIKELKQWWLSMKKDWKKKPKYNLNWCQNIMYQIIETKQGRVGMTNMGQVLSYNTC